jgi:holo-[acyl-carrier protein] synthase
MILAIGIDSIEIARFSRWHCYPEKSLKKIFTAEEIAYCLHNPAKLAERLAARFAAKEAFIKAFSVAFGQSIKSLPRSFFPYIEVKQMPHGSPHLSIDWKFFNIEVNNINLHLSLTHSKSMATAIVIMEQKCQKNCLTNRRNRLLLTLPID